VGWAGVGLKDEWVQGRHLLERCFQHGTSMDGVEGVSEVQFTEDAYLRFQKNACGSVDRFSAAGSSKAELVRLKIWPEGVEDRSTGKLCRQTPEHRANRYGPYSATLFPKPE